MDAHVAKHSGSTTRTYLYLRVGLVALAVFLAASLVIELAFGETDWLGSISAYYYTPVRSVFVGTLCAMGVCLIAIKGRDRPREDLMLNLAGMCAPVVALCPTPLEDSAACGGETRCVPDGYVPGVVNNIEALIVVGVIAVLFAARTVRRGASERGDLVALGLAAGGLVAFTLWFALGRGSFLDYAHYGTAVPMFGLIVAVALVNAAEVDDFVTSGGALTMVSAGGHRGRAVRTLGLRRRGDAAHRVHGVLDPADAAVRPGRRSGLSRPGRSLSWAGRPRRRCRPGPRPGSACRRVR